MVSGTAVGTRVPARATVLAWLPFAITCAVHLGAKLAGADIVDRSTKPLLMVALLIPILVLGRRERTAPYVLLLAGVLLSWAGDVTLHWFVIGLSCFLVAHLLYVGMFITAFRRRASWWSLAYVVWFVVFLAVLWQPLGGYLLPVAVYGVALAAMAATATRGGLVTALGGVAFVASDTLLAFRLFTPSMQGVIADVVIMALYLLAQTLLVVGMLRRPPTRAGAPATA